MSARRSGLKILDGLSDYVLYDGFRRRELNNNKLAGRKESLLGMSVRSGLEKLDALSDYPRKEMNQHQIAGRKEMEVGKVCKTLEVSPITIQKLREQDGIAPQFGAAKSLLRK